MGRFEARMAVSCSPHLVSFAAESLGSACPNLLFEDHFQLFSLSTSFHQWGVGIPPAEQVDSGICIHRDPVEAHRAWLTLSGCWVGWMAAPSQAGKRFFAKWDSCISASQRTSNSSEEASWLKRMPNNCGVEKRIIFIMCWPRGLQASHC